MKTISIVVLILGVASSLVAQEETVSGWRIMPGATGFKFFPGQEIKRDAVRYEGTGLSVQARAFHSSLQHVAFTFSGGVNWFYRTSGPEYYLTQPTAQGVGYTLQRYGDFSTFPLTLGVQFYLPQTDPQKLMLFVGAEGAIHFINGEVEFGDQIRLGYNLMGGFGVSIFEFAIRYSAFSDMKNLGVQMGFRFKSFSI